jgi:hypothetical protein
MKRVVVAGAVFMSSLSSGVRAQDLPAPSQQVLTTLGRQTSFKAAVDQLGKSK